MSVSRPISLALLGSAALVIMAFAQPDPGLRTIELAIEDGFRGLARERLEAVRGATTNAVDDIDALAVKLVLAGGAREEARRLLADWPARRALARAYWETWILADEGKTGPALERLAGIGEIPRGDRYAAHLARLHLRLLADDGRASEAYARARAAIESIGDVPLPGREALWLDTISLAALVGPPDAASELLQTFLSEAGVRGGIERERARLWRGYDLLSRGEDAAAWFRDLAPAPSGALYVEMLHAQAEAEAVTNLARAVEILLVAEGATQDPADKAALRVRRGTWMVADERGEEGLTLIADSISLLRDEGAASDALLFVADHHFAGEDFDQAERAYDAHLLAFTNRADRPLALRGKAWSILQQERYPEAAALFARIFREVENRDLQKEALLKQADALYAGGSFEAAGEAYQRFSRVFYGDPLQPQALFQCGRCERATGQDSAARRRFQTIASVYSETPVAERALLELADMKQEAGEFELASAAYEEYLELFPDGEYRPQALFRQAMCHYRLEDFGRAQESFETVIRNHPENPLAERAAYWQGWTLFAQEDEAGARRHFADFLAAHPQSAWQEDILFWLAERDFNDQEWERAETGFVDLASRFPDGKLSGTAYYWAGRAATAQKEYTRAVEHYTSMVRARPDGPRVPEALYGQGDALAILGTFTEAINVFGQLIQEHPDTYLVPAAWNRIGDCYAATAGDNPEHLGEALAAYDAALGTETITTALRLQVLYRRGGVLTSLERPEEAIESYTRAVYLWIEEGNRLDASTRVWFHQSAFEAARLLEERKAYREAVKLYQRVIRVGGPETREAEKNLQRLRIERLIPFSPLSSGIAIAFLHGMVSPMLTQPDSGSERRSRHRRIGLADALSGESRRPVSDLSRSRFGQLFAFGTVRELQSRINGNAVLRNRILFILLNLFLVGYVIVSLLR